MNMKKIFVLIITLVEIALFSSCGRVNSAYNMGVSKYYDDFWFVPSNISQFVLPEQELEIKNVGEDEFDKTVTLQLVFLDKNGKARPIGDVISVLKNGEEIDKKTSKFRVSADETVKLQFRFRKKPKKHDEENTHHIYLQIVDAGDLDQINDQEAKVGSYVMSEADTRWEWVVEQKEIMNPLLKGIIWFFSIFFACVILWFAVLRKSIFKTFDFDVLNVVYIDGDKKIIKDVNLTGAWKVVCSSNPTYQSAFNRLLCGRIEYLTDAFWAGTVEMKPNGSDGVFVIEEVEDGAMPKFQFPSPMITQFNNVKRPYRVKLLQSTKIANISIE